MTTENPLGLRGIEFVEFTSPEPSALDKLFTAIGFSREKTHRDLDVDYYGQNGIHFLVNKQDEGFAADFRDAHGPSICSMGMRVDDASAAFDEAVERGAKPATGGFDFDFPAIYGIGDSLIYFIDRFESSDRLESSDKRGEDGNIFDDLFVDHPEPNKVESKGFYRIDHLTNNVFKGKRDVWASFYKDVFGFQEIRYFDIKGKKTSLTSYALRSPCGTFCLPINEGNEEKSQIEEYLREYDGEGIQHIALMSDDLLKSLDDMQGGPVQTLDIADEYYENVFDRVPNVTEDHDRIKDHNVLVDGDEEGYLLQIFTKNVIGPIFFELIQRKEHESFGEGNFQALFESIERDQERRGVFDD
jgi:4-hydroxyphenylpyruvate dioxygenase